MTGGEVRGTRWRAEYGEIAERHQFRVGYVGSEAWEAYFPISGLSDLISVLTGAASLSPGQFARGTIYQAEKLNDWQQTLSIQPLSYSKVPPYLELYSADRADLLSTLAALQAALSALEPGDWDDTKPRPIPEAQLPERLTEEALNATFVPRIPQKISLDTYSALVIEKPSDDPATWDWAPAFASAISDAEDLGAPVSIEVVGVRPTSEPLVLTGETFLDCCAGVVKALPGFADGDSVVTFGSSLVPWTASGGTVSVDCGDQHIVGIDFANCRRASYDAVKVEFSTYIGVRAGSSYGLSLPKVDVRMSALIASREVNAEADSVGLLVTTSDCNFGAGDISYASTGLRVTGNNNTFGGFHTWGVYEKDGTPQSAPMMFGVDNQGQANVFVGTIADSPSLLDYDAAASLTNGGYGFVNRTNGHQSKFIGCTVFVPNRVASAGETLPTGKLVGYYTGQTASYISCEITDQTSAAFVAGLSGQFAGPTLQGCFIWGRLVMRLGGSLSQPLFARKPYFSRGVELNLTSQDSNENSTAWGAASFGLTKSFLTVTTNFEGQARTSKIEREKSGTTTYRGTMTWLTSTDKGYCYFDETLGKPVWWNGSGWVDAAGTAA